MPRFDVFGRYEVDVERRDDRWLVLRRGQGTRRPLPGVVIPGDATDGELARWLEDLLHEEARPGTAVRRLD